MKRFTPLDVSLWDDPMHREQIAKLNAFLEEVQASFVNSVQNPGGTPPSEVTPPDPAFRFYGAQQTPYANPGPAYPYYDKDLDLTLRGGLVTTRDVDAGTVVTADNIVLRELSGTGDNTLTLEAPFLLTNKTLRLPSGHGTVKQVLAMNGAADASEWTTMGTWLGVHHELSDIAGGTINAAAAVDSTRYFRVQEVGTLGRLYHVCFSSAAPVGTYGGSASKNGTTIGASVFSASVGGPGWIVWTSTALLGTALVQGDTVGLRLTIGAPHNAVFAGVMIECTRSVN